MCHHELWYPYTQYWFRWTNISETYAPFDLNLGWGYWANYLHSIISNFSVLPWHNWAIAYVHISKVSSQLSCSDTCQIWMWLKKIRYLICHIISGAWHDKLGPHHKKSGPKNTYLVPHMISQGPHISRSRRDKWGTQHSRGSHIIILGPWHSKSGSSHDKSWFNIIISEP